MKLVGTPLDAEAESTVRVTAYASEDLSSTTTTQRFGRATYMAAVPVQDSEYTFERALALAHTMPATLPEDLGLRSSGVREIEQLSLWLEPRDRAGFAAHGCVPSNPLTRAWQLWHQLPAPLTLCATMLCVLSALAFGLLTQ